MNSKYEIRLNNVKLMHDTMTDMNKTVAGKMKNHRRNNANRNKYKCKVPIFLKPFKQYYSA